MLKELVQKLQRLTKEPVDYDPSGLGDPVAMKTEWTPARGGGASFRTHKLVEVDSFRMEFRASAGAIVFYMIFFLVGVGVMLGFSSSAISSDTKLTLTSLLPMFVGLVFAIAGGAMMYYGSSPKVFDKRRGAFWKGRAGHQGVLARSGDTHSGDLEDVHALQLISEYCRSDKSSYYSYELNVVLEDGARVNIVDHGDHSRLREDAAALSAFLGKPVWDAT